MSVSQPHTKLLNTAARQVLRPLGVVQKGRSRTWFDDQGWWVGVVEFQPSSWSRGSYLNVGVAWLWNVSDHAGLDYGGRVPVPGDGQFVEYENEQQFEPLARHLAMLAADRVEQQRHLFGTLEAAAASLRETPASDLRGSLDAGVALGLVGEAALARAMFARFTTWYESHPEARDAQFDRHRRTQVLAERVGNSSLFAEQIRTDVAKARELLNLGETSLPF